MHVIALDCETCLITPSVQAPPLVCVSLDAGLWQSLMHHTQCVAYLTDLLTRDVIIVGHNISYDMACIMAYAPELTPLIFKAYQDDRVTDTIVRQKLCDIAGGVYRGYENTQGGMTRITYDLASVAKRHLGITMDKNTWRMRYDELRDLPCEAWPDAARAYALGDAKATRDVFMVQEENVDYLTDQYRQTRADLFLKLSSIWGINTDALAIGTLERQTHSEYSAIAEQLRACKLLKPDFQIKGHRVSGSRDTKAAKERVVRAYGALGRPVPLTDTGTVSLDKNTCEESGDKDLIAYAQLTSLKTVLGKDIPALMSGTMDPIHTHFEVLVASGRTSSSKPNIQNPRRKPGVRECFVPRPGNVFVSADYSGLELCTLGQVCMALFGHSELAQAMNTGLDPHLMIASQILGCHYDYAKGIRTGTIVEGLYTKDQVDNARQTGKVANFGFPGGLGAQALCAFALATYDVRLTVSQAQGLKDAWLTTWPEMRDFFRYVGTITDKAFPTVEQLYAKRYRGGCTYTEACNTFFQGLGADVAKAAGWEITRACYALPDSPLFGTRVVNFIHDEFILECPENRAHEAARELSRVMVACAKPWLPDVQIKAPALLSRCWSNEAEPKYVEGRLVPWG